MEVQHAPDARPVILVVDNQPPVADLLGEDLNRRYQAD